MDAVNARLLALAAGLVILGIGGAVLMFQRVGWDYMFSRGNPRNRAGAHEGGIDIVKGLIFIISSAAIGAWLVGVLGGG